MSEPSYCELSQPKSFESIIKNKQNEISEANARISKIQTELKEGPLKEETLSESLVKYQSEIRKYESLIQDLTKTEHEYNRYATLLNQANINITYVQSQRQEREKKFGDIQHLKDNIIKLESELTKLKKLRNLAIYHEDLYKRIQELDDPEILLGKLTDPGGDSIFLPWVDEQDLSTSRFKLIDRQKVEYFPRKRLRNIIQTFEDSLKAPSEHVHTLYGTIGAGKSHILLAMACYYFRRRDRVIYFSKAKDALKIENWKKKFMFLLYQESRKEQPDINFIEATQEALALIEKAPRIGEFLQELKLMNGEYLRIFVDQMNTIRDANKNKHKENNTLVINSEYMITKLDFEALLDNSGAFMVLSSSANDDDMYSDHFAGNEIPRIYIPVLSGLTPVEYNKWFERCVKKLEAAEVDVNMLENFIESKDKIEFLTRAAPLYLRLYFDLLQPIYDETVDKMKDHKEIMDIERNVLHFYSKKLSLRDKGKYLSYARDCINDKVLERHATNYVMRRYVYVLNEMKYDEENERQGCLSCGFVAEYIAEALKQNNIEIDWSLDDEYVWQIETKKQFVAILEDIGLKDIAGIGLSSCGINLVEPTRIEGMTQATQVRLVEQDGERILYRALRENFEGIDALYLTDKLIIGINFTTNAKHKDPFSLFIENMKKIPDFLTNWRKYKIYFVWKITPNCSGKLFEQRERTVDGVVFDVMVEYFQENVIEVYADLVKKHRAQIAEVIAKSTNGASNVRKIHPKVENPHNTRSNKKRKVDSSTQMEPDANMSTADSESEIPSSTNEELVAKPAPKKAKPNPKNARKKDPVRSRGNPKTNSKTEANPDPNPVSNKRKVGSIGGNSSTDGEPEALEGAPIKRTRSSKARLAETRMQVKGKGN